MRILLINITLLLLICNNTYGEIGVRGSSSSDYTGFTDKFHQCTLPIDYIVSGTCILGTFGLWIIIAIVFGFISAIFRK